MKAITIKGFKKTGKTTTCEAVIGELIRRGYTVGSAKDTHADGFGFAMDTPGKDTYRHAEAGSTTVMIAGAEETDVLFKRRVEIGELLGLFEEDYLVTEGDIGLPLVNIVTGKTTEDLDGRRDENTVAFSGIISNEIDVYDGLPVINATKEVGRLVDLIEERSSEV